VGAAVTSPREDLPGSSPVEQQRVPELTYQPATDFPPRRSLGDAFATGIASLTGIVFGMYLTALGFLFVFNQWFGEPADVGAPCAMFCPFVGLGLLFGSMHVFWMNERARKGKRIFPFWDSIQMMIERRWRDLE
jgi:hypothetical protein